MIAELTRLFSESTVPEPIKFRKPEPEDGAAIWSLIQECSPLDENSMYCNLLQCDHFRDTCIVTEIDGQIAGWISGYLMPHDPETLFIWQVAVSEAARGRGLGRKMLSALLDRPTCAGVEQIKTTITRDNAASWALFRSFARREGGQITDTAHYERDDHFDGQQATEHMVTISFAGQARHAA